MTKVETPVQSATRRLRSIPHLRWYIAFLLCLASALNYLDRQTLSVLKETIGKELSLSNTDYGTITAWFLASYGVMYAVSGRIIDVVGTRKGFVFFVCGWSIANMLHCMATTVAQFSMFRFLLGVFEPGSFTGGVKAVSEWFPMRERALAIGIFNAGTAIGSVAAAPIVSIIAVHWGWRSAFLVTGVLGIVWLVPWLLFFKQPKHHPRLSEEERQLIVEGAATDIPTAKPPSWAALLRMRETWGCILVRALTDPISYFLVFWIPPYFQKQHGFELKDMAMFLWLPYATAALGSLSGGAIPRFLMGRGWTLDKARKTTMACMTVALLICLFSVTQTADKMIALYLVAGMTFCHGGWSNITLPAEVFPKSAVATVTGLGGALGSWMGALASKTTGSVVDVWGFTPIFIACAVLYPTALLLVYVLIGKLGVTRDVK